VLWLQMGQQQRQRDPCALPCCMQALVLNAGVLLLLLLTVIGRDATGAGLRPPARSSCTLVTVMRMVCCTT
jgi:hypothetical protein